MSTSVPQPHQHEEDTALKTVFTHGPTITIQAAGVMAIVSLLSWAAYSMLNSELPEMTTVHIYALDSAGHSVKGVRIESFQKNSRYGGGQWLIRETDARGFVEFEIEKGYPAFISVKRDERRICSDEPYGIGRSIKNHALDGVQYIFNPETCTFRQNGSAG